MIRYCRLLILTTFVAGYARADNVYYLYELGRCEVSLYENKELKIVDGKQFERSILNVQKLARNPDHVVFKINNKIYVTHETCVMSTDKKKISNELQGNEFKKQPREMSEKEKFNTYKYFAEFDFGHMKVADEGAVASDYNAVLPSTSVSHPTSWGKADDSSYSSGTLLSLGFGIRSAHTKIRFLAFKLRFLSGKKSDALDLTDLNTSISQRGTWTYEDSFKNFYVGYKLIFRDYSAWKPVLAAYIGAGHMSTTLSDGLTSYELNSLGVAALLEAGLEYHLNSHWGVATILGYEYLGSRNMKFSDDNSGVNFKTNMSYSNQYFTFGLKYYFK